METISLPQSELLKFSIKIGAIKLFIDGIRLENNRICPYLFNSRFFNHGDYIEILVNAYVEVIIKSGIKFDYIFNYFDNEILSLMIAKRYFELTSIKVGTFYYTQKGTDYDDKKRFIGFPEGKKNFSGKKILILEDLLMDYCYESIEIIKMLEGTPVGCIICFDGQELAKDSNLSVVQHYSEKTGLPTLSVLNLEELKDVLKNFRLGSIERYMFQKIIIYEKEYCINKQ